MAAIRRHEVPAAGWQVYKSRRGWLLVREDWTRRQLLPLADPDSGDWYIWTGKDARKQACAYSRELAVAAELDRLRAEVAMLRGQAISPDVLASAAS